MAMQRKKIGTILDGDLLERVKQRAYQQQITLNRIFEKALSAYLLQKTEEMPVFSAVESSFGVIKLPLDVVKKIAEEDVYALE